jgi:hypothetical protein
MITINSPLFVTLPRKTKADKKFILNQNNYRNTHYITLNDAKRIYKQLIAPQLIGKPSFDHVHVSFKLFPKTKRLTDIGNVCCVHEKFFMDAFVELGKLPDDNYLHHSMTLYKFGEVDKEDPRVEITIDAGCLESWGDSEEKAAGTFKHTQEEE